MEINWISESENLPRIGQDVLLALPRQFKDLWDIRIVKLLVRHEGVITRPVQPGSNWPTNFYWGDGRNRENTLVTGNGWWSPLTLISLPPKALHKHINGYDCIVQDGDAFVPQVQL